MQIVPEYHSLKTTADSGTVNVTVSIDRNSRMMPAITMDPSVLARLVAAFLAGELDFMSFDEHPKRLTGMSATRKGNALAVKLTARSLADDDEFPSNWEIADPELFGAAPWNGQMK